MGLLIKRILSSCQRELEEEEVESRLRFQPVYQLQQSLTAVITVEPKICTLSQSLWSVPALTDCQPLLLENHSSHPLRRVSQNLERRLFQLWSSDKEKHLEEEKVIFSILKTMLPLL